MKKILFIAAGLLALAACNKADSQPEQATYELSVEATVAPATKGLALNGKTLNAVWASGDAVTVFNGTSSIGTLTPQSTGSATTVLKGSITASGLSAGTKLTLLAPGSAWLYSGQDGTLSSIAKYNAYSLASVAVTSVSGSSVATGAASFENQQAIVKFILQDSNGSPLSPDELEISAASGKIVRAFNTSMEPLYGSLSIEPLDDTNEIYVALRNENASADTYSLTATVGNKVYKASKAGVLFENGKYYAGVVKMEEEIHTYTVTGGPASVFGSNWDPTDQNNNLIKQSDGTYKSKTYNITSDPTNIEFKVVKDYAYSNGEWGGDGDNGNYVFTAGVGPMVITFDPTKPFGAAISATYTKSTKEGVYTVAGTPASVFGSEWDPSYTSNDMVKQSNGTYVKTYSSVAAGTEVKFKVTVNHDWSGAFGKSACDQADVTGDGDGNCVYTKSNAGTLTITFNPSTRKITVS